MGPWKQYCLTSDTCRAVEGNESAFEGAQDRGGAPRAPPWSDTLQARGPQNRSLQAASALHRLPSEAKLPPRIKSEERLQTWVS